MRLPSESGPQPRPASSIHLTTDYEKMVGPTRSKLRKSDPDASQTRRSRGAGAVEPPLERAASPERPKRWRLLQPYFLGGRNLPGGTRNYAQRRTRNLNAQNYLHLEEDTKLLHGRFQFLHSLLDQLHRRVQALHNHRFSYRTLFGVGEQSLLQSQPGRIASQPKALKGLHGSWGISFTSVWCVGRVDDDV